MLRSKLLGATASEKLFTDDVFAVTLYTGNGSSQTINNGIDLAGKGGLVWTKGRSIALDNYLWDTQRGATYRLVSNSTSASLQETNGVTSFNSSGFSIGAGGGWNNAGSTYTSWTFRRAPKFFDVRTVSHTNGTATNIALADLGTVGMVTAKITGTTSDWITWHRSLTAGNNLRLNTTAAQTTTNAWLSVSGTTATLSASAPTGTYVIYAWAHDTSADGIIQCGSYVGNGNSSGNLSVTLGFEPQFLLIKGASAGASGGPWAVMDNMRGLKSPDASAGRQNPLYANTFGAEDATVNIAAITATGFVLNNNTSPYNALGETYIYIAIRRPNKPPTSGTAVYNAIARTGTGATATVTGVGFAPDLVMPKARSASYAVRVYDRLRGAGNEMYTSATSAESADATSLTAFGMNGASFGASAGVNENTTTFINWFFRRAPGFHDQICYNGTGANKTEAHNLGVQPQLWIVKRRNSTGSWTIGSTLLNANEKIIMPSPNGRVTDATAWNSTYPTATNISLGTQADVNASGGTYALWMWATLPGISSVFTYTGNGTSQTVNCGFSTGARFVMIIRVTASTAQDIFIWDTARGIVAGNDPRLSLNTTAAEVTTLDTIDTDSTGFIVNTDASNVNVNGAVYIGLAIS